MVSFIFTWFLFGDNFKRPASSSASTALSLPSHDNVTALNQLLCLPPEKLNQIDLALMNLLCAQNLTGAENLDIEQCLGILNQWTEIVKNDTKKRLPAYYQNPNKYDNSVAVFRMVTLVLTLKNTLGVHYNLDAAHHWDFSDSRDIFIHGLLGERRSGTCTSIPVLCAAIGRRLGYPVKLAQAKGHMFFRWEDKHECFNVEACCPGVDVRDDEYYCHWPEEITKEELHRCSYLKSLTPAEELAEFMGCRSSCLADTGRFAEAQIAAAWQCRLYPRQSSSLMHLLSLTDHLLNELARNEMEITGSTPGYAVPVYSEGQTQYYFTWRQPETNPPSGKPLTKSVNIEQLTRRVDRLNAQKRQQMQNPLLPNTQPPMPGQRVTRASRPQLSSTQPPMPVPRPIPKVIKKKKL